MKRMITVVAMCLSLGITTMTAQNKTEEPKPQKETPEQHINKQAMRMVDALSLDDKTSEKFITTYKNFKNDMMEVMKKYPRPERVPQGAEQKQRKTDAEIEKEIKDQFSMSREILEVREHYYNEFRKFLNPRQIQKIYSMEHEGMKKLGGPHQPMKGNNQQQRNSKWNGHPGSNQQQPQHPQRPQRAADNKKEQSNNATK